MARLTIGMAAYDDFDGVYFTIQSLRLTHSPELDDIEFLILDNHPGGPDAPALRSLAQRVPRCRYVPFGGYAGTSVRDLIFREATTEYVLCVDSHVLLPSGSVRALLDYFDARPGCRDLVQGPLLRDSLTGEAATHLRDGWEDGMWGGAWGADPRGQDPGGEPFEVQMQGLGLFACGREAWPGLNPRMRGHGGEEGYLHEKVRRAGGRVICHPGVRWLHRFRDQAMPYPSFWRDRSRNYLIAFDEIGWETTGLRKHLHELFDDEHPEKAELVLAQAQREAASPYAFFDAVFCLHRDATQRRWRRSRRALGCLGVDWLAEPVLAVHDSRAATLRAIVTAARRRGLEAILILQDDQLPATSWTPPLTCGPTEPVITDGPALAIHRTAYDRVLAAPARTWLQNVRDTLPPLAGEWTLPRVPQWAIDGLYGCLEATDAILTRLGVPYSALAGTLLGVIRHHGMIPWDDDADLGIRVQDVPVLLAARTSLMERGYDIEITDTGLKVLPLNGQRQPHVDLFPLTRPAERWIYANATAGHTLPNPDFTDQDFDRLQPRQFGPITLLCVPSRTAHDYLARAYGPAWPTSVRLKRDHHSRTDIEHASMRPEDFTPALPSSWPINPTK